MNVNNTAQWGIDTPLPHELPARIARTLKEPPLPLEAVLSACDALADAINETTHLPLLLAAGMPPASAKANLLQAKHMLSRFYLTKRLQTEFGENVSFTTRFTPYGAQQEVCHRFVPLGAILHIAAGNMDVLPVFSVIEGLLTGNINLLKPPTGDDALSAYMLRALIALEARLAPYIYIYECPSSDTATMKTLMDAVDAIAVWGSDETVKAVRRMASPATKIIEWGHKLSFAYIADTNVGDDALFEIARHICQTDQLYCNSCQGLYVNTDAFDTLCAFAERFLPLLDRAANQMPRSLDPFVQAQKTLELRTEQLQAIHDKKRLLQTDHCSLLVTADPALAPSYMLRNCFIKPLPQAEIISTLRPYKSHLQSVALLAAPEQREAFERLFLCTGAVRITGTGAQLAPYCGMPHDGEYALRRYMKTVSITV